MRGCHPGFRRDVRLDPERVEARFGRDRFREEIQSLVRGILDGEETPQRFEELPAK